MTTKKRKTANWRNSLLARIHIAKKQMPHMDDALYRELLEERYGKKSSAKLTMYELKDFAAFLESKGAELTNSREKAREPQEDFYEIPDGVAYADQKRWIAAMWYALGWKMSGLDVRCKQQFKVEKFLWLDDQSHLQTLAKDLIGRCHSKGIDPDNAQPKN